MSCAYWAPKSTTRTGRASVPASSSGPRASGRTPRLSRGPGLSFSLISELLGNGTSRRLAVLEVGLHLPRDAVLGEEGEKGHHAAGRDQQEAGDRPAQECDEHEVDDEIGQVEVAVRDLGDQAEVDPGVASDG